MNEDKNRWEIVDNNDNNNNDGIITGEQAKSLMSIPKRLT